MDQARADVVIDPNGSPVGTNQITLNGEVPVACSVSLNGMLDLSSPVQVLNGANLNTTSQFVADLQWDCNIPFSLMVSSGNGLAGYCGSSAPACLANEVLETHAVRYELFAFPDNSGGNRNVFSEGNCLAGSSGQCAILEADMQDLTDLNISSASPSADLFVSLVSLTGSPPSATPVLGGTYSDTLTFTVFAN